MFGIQSKITKHERKWENTNHNEENNQSIEIDSPKLTQNMNRMKTLNHYCDFILYVQEIK